MNSVAILALAILGAGAIGLGSFVVIVAPGDGQTGMVAFPLWGIGALLGIGSILGLLIAKPGRAVGGPVAGLALLAIGSVVWSYVVCMRMESESQDSPSNLDTQAE